MRFAQLRLHGTLRALPALQVESRGFGRAV
jgi:hypothetical protein